ncbi:hypothetical protein [Mucilaginibacter gynuensis]|uniref:hypothetical protein n=1 Tax=Mucilaginibacter gynuensis TaxID=1302236 RepID=UPI0031EEF2B4
MKKEAANKPTQDKECHACSPFFTCGTCTGFVAVKPLVHQAIRLVLSPVKANTVYRQAHLQEISLSIWQPPKLS